MTLKLFKYLLSPLQFGLSRLPESVLQPSTLTHIKKAEVFLDLALLDHTKPDLEWLIKNGLVLLNEPEHSLALTVYYIDKERRKCALF